MTVAHTTSNFPATFHHSLLTEPQFCFRIHSSLQVHVLWGRWAGAVPSSCHAGSILATWLVWAWARDLVLIRGTGRLLGDFGKGFPPWKKQGYVGSSPHCRPSSSQLAGMKGVSPNPSHQTEDGRGERQGELVLWLAWWSRPSWGFLVMWR